MAEFCKQCAEELGFEPDFVGLCGETEMIQVLCETCGITWVDSTGVCISEDCEIHGKKEDKKE